MENLAFIWISGNQRHDFRTVNNFRLRLKDDIKSVFKQIVQYGIQEGIIEGKDVFIDPHKKICKCQQAQSSLEKASENHNIFKSIINSF